MPFIQLDEYRGEGPLEREVYPKILAPRLRIFPFIYENTQWLTVSTLTENGQKSVVQTLGELVL